MTVTLLVRWYSPVGNLVDAVFLLEFHMLDADTRVGRTKVV
jgi:hypothetical protein